MPRFPAVLLSIGLALAFASARADDEYTAAERSHWSLQPRTHPVIPSFDDPEDRAWVRNPIDAFVLVKLHEQRLKPAEEADRRTLIRRLSFNLTGLPPTPAEIDAFESDTVPDAYNRLVDRLLSSPHYGERWGQHWLDVARFAESEGFEYDRHHPHAWRYRDYVIRSFQDDKPYDQFVREQIAGDEMSPQSEASLVAAGFLRLGPVRRNAGNPDVAFSRNEVLTEMTDTVGAAFLGMTVGCARCHDHMFDPIRQTDYYRLQAFLASTQEYDVPLADSTAQVEWKTRHQAISAEVKKLESEIDDATGPSRIELQARLKTLERQLPPPLPALFSVRNVQEKRTEIHVLKRGAEERPGDRVGPRPLGVLLGPETQELSADVSNPRTRLAEWIVDPRNPLTARVIVNRLWLHHFGRGIVHTPNDFGLNGGFPTHPELLDFLANELVANGWRIKPVQRLIVSSATYRQSSHSKNSEHARRTDPENVWLWKFPRRRLEAEAVRDSLLAVSGTLNLKAGGPSVMVPVDAELVELLYKPSQWTVTEDASEHFRRSIYLIAKRNLCLPFLEVFDQPGPQASCPKRESSTHAPQALELLNGTLSNELARAFAARLEREAGPNLQDRVILGYRLATGRPPTGAELQASLQFLETQPLREFALTLFNLNDFLYVK